MSTAATPRGVLGGVAAAVVLLACVGKAPSESDCERACSLAGRCGLLPSALGGVTREGIAANEDDCVARCLASDGGSRQVIGLLDVLAGDDADITEPIPLCTPTGTAACEELVEVLEDEPSTSELRVTTSLTVAMVSGVTHVNYFGPEAWCCFTYDRELGSEAGEQGTRVDPSDATEPRSEVTAVHEMFAPTYDCFDRLETELERAGGAPGEPAPREVCDQVLAVWGQGNTEPGAAPDLQADPCVFARKSARVRGLGIPEVATACTQDGLDSLLMEIRGTRIDWNLEPGGVLITDEGVTRGAAEVEARLEEMILDELTRPDALLEEVCAELDDEAGGSACDAADSPPDPRACTVGPPCSEADCLAESPGCDPTLCDAEVSPPGRDCSFFGIETVKLGYRTDEGIEVLGEPITSCATQASVETRFEGVKVGTVVPIALVEGTLPGPFLVDDAPSAGDGSFSWYLEGDPRWIAAGQARLQLPSPRLEFTEYRYENPLQLLGWTPPRVPKGQGCDEQPLQCESLGNDNCDDGIDNDGDGFIDGAGPWCDALFFDLIERCVVTEPGKQPVVGCRDEP